MALLKAENISSYLIERGILTLESIVDGDYLVHEQSSRNHNFKIVRRRSPGFFVKQANPTEHHRQTVAREAACYKLASRHSELAGLSALMPRLHLFDSAHGILVLELLEDAETLWEHHLRRQCFPEAIAALQGERFGRFHRHAEKFQAKVEESGLFARQLPWILSFHQANPQYLSQMSQGNQQLLGILKQYPELTGALDELRRSWKVRLLIHGDIKWENLMLCRKNGPDADLKVIDWEMADLGDECWDLGSVLQAYLTFWIFMLPLDTASLEAATASTPFRPEQLKAALGTFWRSYAMARGLDHQASRKMLRRSLACGAARMVQTAYESIQSSKKMTPHGLYQLQMSMNVLRDPATAAKEMVGL
jgi:hypothetical protein